VITSNLRLADAPGNFQITKKESGLSKDSVVNISQGLTLDKTFLTDQVGKLSSRKISSIERRTKACTFNRVVPFDNLLIFRIFLSSICQLRGQRTGLLRKLIDS